MADHTAVQKKLETYVELVNEQRASINEARDALREALKVGKRATTCLRKLEALNEIEMDDGLFPVLTSFEDAAAWIDISPYDRDSIGDAVLARSSQKALNIKTTSARLLDMVLEEHLADDPDPEEFQEDADGEEEEDDDAEGDDDDAE